MSVRRTFGIVVNWISDQNAVQLCTYEKHSIIGVSNDIDALSSIQKCRYLNKYDVVKQRIVHLLCIIHFYVQVILEYRLVLVGESHFSISLRTFSW